jgi:hypothetical protein
MDYEEFTEPSQYMLVQNRLRQYEGRHFEASLNLDLAKATNRTAEVSTLEKSVADLELAIQLTKEKLATLPKPDDSELGQGVPPVRQVR